MNEPISNAQLNNAQRLAALDRRGYVLRGTVTLVLTLVLFATVLAGPLSAEGEWETTPASERALAKGLQWLAKSQGKEGNWRCNDLGLVGMGALAFMAAGHAPGRGEYGAPLQRALDYMVDNAKPSGLLNIANMQRDMYNHGLATLVLGQAHGMSTRHDQRLNTTLDHALRLIALTQCDDGGWSYQAQTRPRGHDLSLVVMQAKALRSAMDSGLEVPSEVVDKAVRSVREHYWPRGGRGNRSEQQLRDGPGQFTYSKGGGGPTLAMAAAGVVCLQELGCYDDWRIAKNMELIGAAIRQLPEPKPAQGIMPFDSYTLYYVGQSLYQVGGDDWRRYYPKLRDYLVASQRVDKKRPDRNGSWIDRGANGKGRLSGASSDLYATSVACFILAIPNRYLPILQEGRIQSLRKAPAIERP